jgi:hypothetical protein
MPRSDKERLEVQARQKLRDTSDLAWVLIREGLDRLEQIDRKPCQPTLA